MNPASKHGDPQIGVDIHLCTVPPSPSPVPLPTPHTSIVFDPFDYVPIFGATVTVCGMKRATAGTNATVIHIPPGFPFAPKLPDKDDEIFMGSSTVVADGDPFSFTAVPTLGCQIAGMPSPPRLKKKGPPKAMLLPTTVNLAIPTNVFVGGPPTISLMGMAFRAGFAALGKFAKSGLFRKMRKGIADKLGLKKPGFLRCKVFRAEPVNILNGSVDVEQQDFNLPGRIPIDWVRTYRSDNTNTGLCGPGWETLADTRMTISAEDGRVLVHCPTFGLMSFNRLPIAKGQASAELELTDGSLLVDHGREYRITTKDDRIYHFAKDRASIDAHGQQRWGIGRISDRCGNTLDFEYRFGQVVAINESAGRRLALTVEDKRLTAITLIDPAAHKEHTFMRYAYDAAGDLIAAIDALGAPYRFAYDAHRLVRHTDRNGLSFYYAYEKSAQEEWRVIHAWGDDGLYDYRFAYIDPLNERRITDALGHVSTVKLNADSLPISEIDPLGGITTFEYDEAGRTTAVVDQDQYRIEYHYDDHGNLLKLVRPDGNSIATEFNAADKAVKIIDPNGATWQQEWDRRGLLVRQANPLGAESSYRYDLHGQIVGFTNPRNASTSLSFDSYGNLTHLTDALGNATAFAYDMLGNIIAKTDPLRQLTRYDYDRKGRLRQATLPSGATIACAYDREDNLIRYVDENGAETKLEYCGLGEIKRRLQPDGHSVEYHYDPEERLIGATNQRGERYELKRDALGRIVKEIDYWGQTRRYTYSKAGYLKQSVDPLNRVIQYQTDPLGRITQKLLPDPFNSDQIQAETFEYDANGNLTACENSAIRIQRIFDAEGRLIKERQGEAATITNTYDANGNRLTRSFGLKAEKRRYANTIQYEYDMLDQAIGVTPEGHTPLQLHRNALCQVTHEQLSNHVQRDLAYSPDGYLTAQRVRAREGPLLEQNYQYDAAGNLIEKHDSALGVDQFTYDPLGRLVAHLDPHGRLVNYLNDPAGDRLRTRIKQYSSGGDGTVEWCREGVYDGKYYRFDRAGNLVQHKEAEKEILLRWDANQRLVESAADDQRTHFQYDPLGRRISKTTQGVTTIFFWDGDALLGDLIHAKNDIAPAPLREWIYYPGTFEPLAMLQNFSGVENALYLYHNDPNGCPTRMLNSTGDVVWAAQYDAIGRIKQLLVDRIDNPIRLQGQYWDAEIGLSYNRHRYLDPQICSFISQDLIGLAGGENVYAYGVNIWKWIDPSGLSCKPTLSEAKKLMSMWTKATFVTLSDSIRYHWQKHLPDKDVWTYLRKAANFSKKGAKKKILGEDIVRYTRKSGEYLIEKGGKIVSYGLD